jgi:ring-1,2-phenylacetyl-CoA epoxidase subunit PaaD
VVNTAEATPLQQRVMAALDTVCDPEIPVVTLRELGVLRDVLVSERAGQPHVEVVITPTYSGCPAMAQMAEDIIAALESEGVAQHRITTVLAPAWTTDWITPEAREKLRAYGIAPPASVADSDARAPARGQVLRFLPMPNQDQPACPQCGSPNTECISRHGSTACKALYRCLSCREPFDYFKPH